MISSGLNNTMTEHTHQDPSYVQRRAELETYFDRTAVDGWKKLVTDAPVSKIRQTVRAGRDAMRDGIVRFLPNDLVGWRILDAGCGSGPLAAALAAKGADVLGVDLSAEMIKFAQDRWADEPMMGSVRFEAGDMLAAEHGTFDAIVAMDSIIHYKRQDMEKALLGLAARCSTQMVVTVAPATPLLSTMWFVGKAFPRGDRSPAIVPVSPTKLVKSLLANPSMNRWHAGENKRVNSGFYISHAVEVKR